MRSIRAILILSLTIVIVFVGFSTAIIYYDQALEKEKSTIEQFIHAESASLHGEIALPLWKYDIESVRLLCTERLRQKSIKSIKIIDDEQNVVFHTDDEGAEKKFSVANPITYNGEHIGMMEISFKSPESIKFGKDIFNLTFFILALVVCTAIISVFLLTTWLIAKPFSHITQIISELKNKNYSWQFQGSPLKEIFPIVKGLKELSQELLEQDEKIKAQMKDLEKYNTSLLEEIELKNKAEELLRESKLKQEEAIKAGNVGLWDWNLETNKVRYSKEWKQQIGYEEHEIDDDFEEWRSRVHPDDLEPTLEKVKQSIAEARRNHRVEFRFRHRDGSYRWVLAQASIIQDATGNPVRMLGSHIDITDRKLTENELRKNENLLQRIFEVLPIGLWFADQNGKLIQGNPAGIKIWGAEPHVSPDEYGVFKARRLPSKEEITPDDWALAHTIRDGVTVKDELLEIDAFDGTKKTILNYTAPVLDVDGKVEAAVIINLEISDRLKAEREAFQSEERLKTLINNIPDLIWLKDPDGVYLSCNPTFELFFGATESEIVGKTDYNFIDKELADFFREHDRKAVKSRVPSINEEWLKFKTNDYHGLFETIKTPMFDDDGNLIGVLGIARDITIRHNSEKQRIELEQRLKQSQKMESIGQLAGGIAHDFNNILYPIMGFTQLSKDALPKDHPVQENLADILNGTKRASDLVKRILLFSRQKQKKLAPASLQPIIKESYKLLRASIPANIELTLDLCDEAYSVLCNDSEIHEIILNLCTNAYHAIVKDHGKIILGLKKRLPPSEMNLSPGEYLCLSVKDNGVGIPERIKDKIFEPYTTTKDIGKGSGLGLSVVYGIVQDYKGGINVDSEPGSGSEFRIFLPVANQFVNKKEKIADEEIIISGNEHILFVDDEESIVKLCVRVLERSGYTVTAKKDSKEAFEVFKSNPDIFDLVITDMSMPGMVGSELSRKILEIKPDIPIIICSGYSERLDKTKAEELKISAYLDKPLTIKNLLKVVGEVLKS